MSVAVRLFGLCLVAGPALALDLPVGARMTAEQTVEVGRYAVPTGVFDGQNVPLLNVDGFVKRQAWLVPGGRLTPLQMTEGLRKDLEADGFKPVLDCVASACGGFDFRFAIDVLPAPGMYVNLRDYQFVTLLRGSETEPEAVVTLMASTNRDGAYVQVTEVRRDAAFVTDQVTKTSSPRPQERPVRPVASPDIADLVASGSIVLEGLEFEPGATRLGPGPFEALDALAEFLKDNPDLRIALVGHTDSVGSFEGNVRVSRARASAVRARLIEAYGLEADRLSAEGMGYLAPRASNLTEDGRELNRRVEAILLTAE